MFGIRTRVTATAVAGLAPVRGRVANLRAGAPRRIPGTAKGLNAVRGRHL
jgi:hypothetical protein